MTSIASGRRLRSRSRTHRHSGRQTALVCASALILLLTTIGGAEARYQQVKVACPTASDREKVFIHPDLELMGDDDGAVILLSRPELTDALRAQGFQVEVQVEDLEAHYRDLQGPQSRGDFGDWHTYAETVAEMNLIHAAYPSLTTAPFSIGTTGEGRTIWAMKVSDNPNVDEDEAEILFDGVHHAREIMTVEMNLDFMRYLCENYGSDPVVSDIVNRREVFFVPIVNVDGFVYNETTNPGGGGLWRKNRRANGGGCFGVDNNRNYPFQWIGSGSSTDPCDDTYRGPSAGSEPENQALINLINARNFTIWQSYHSVAGMVLFPWGYTTAHTPDDTTFRAIAAEMAAPSGYITGQPPEILYSVNGGAFDWGYGDTSQHDKIFSFTTEIGGSGFWPAPSERDGLIAENLHSNLYLCQIAGAYPTVLSLAVQGGNGNGRLDPGESAALVVTIRNDGVITPATNLTVKIFCDDPYVQFSDAVATIGTVAPGATGANGADPFEVVVDAAAPQGRGANFLLELSADGGAGGSETIALTIGQSPVILANDFEEVGEAWTVDPTNTATQGAWTRVDPFPTPYQPGDDTTPAPGVNAWITGQNTSEGAGDVDSGVAASRSPLVNLSAYTNVRLNLNYFFGQRDPGDDPSGDFFKLSVSNNGGASFPVDLVSIGDVAYAATWRNLTADLEDLIPLTSQMMFRVQAADGTFTGDLVEAGLDDIFLYDQGNGNEPPSAPILLSPINGAGNQPGALDLAVLNASDPEGQTLTYGFRVYADAELTQVVRTVDGVASGTGSTSWTVAPPLPTGSYWWRAYAADPSIRGVFMPAASFTVSTSTAVDEGPVAQLELQASPNPAGQEVTIRYVSPRTAQAELRVYDVNGRLVRSLPGARWTAGWQETRWDGRDAMGNRVPAGVYAVRLVTPNETRSVRVVRLQ